MKTIKKTVLVVALMLVTLVSYANGTPTFNDNKAKVELKNVKKGHRIFIKDSQNQILYKKTIKKEGVFTRNFNFSALKNGVYYLEVIKDFEIITSPFLIKSGVAYFNKKKKKTTFKPSIRVRDNKVLISKLNIDSSKMIVKIYYLGNEILNEEVSGKKILNRVYVLNKKYNGEYSIAVSVNNRTYSSSFSM